MQATIATITFVAICSFQAVHAYPSGAPSGACASIYPYHSTTSRSLASSPFILNISQITADGGYVPGKTYTMVLTGSQKFEGFLIQGRSGSTPAGRFIVDPRSLTTQNSACTPPESAVTHTSNSLKSSLQLVWNAPPKGTGDVIFHYAVVISYSIFYATILSPVVKETIPMVNVPRPSPVVSMKPTEQLSTAAILIRSSTAQQYFSSNPPARLSAVVYISSLSHNISLTSFLSSAQQYSSPNPSSASSVVLSAVASTPTHNIAISPTSLRSTAQPSKSTAAPLFRNDPSSTAQQYSSSNRLSVYASSPTHNIAISPTSLRSTVQPSKSTAAQLVLNNPPSTAQQYSSSNSPARMSIVSTFVLASSPSHNIALSPTHEPLPSSLPATFWTSSPSHSSVLATDAVPRNKATQGTTPSYGPGSFDKETSPANELKATPSYDGGVVDKADVGRHDDDDDAKRVRVQLTHTTSVILSTTGSLESKMFTSADMTPATPLIGIDVLSEYTGSGCVGLGSNSVMALMLLLCALIYYFRLN